MMLSKEPSRYAERRFPLKFCPSLLKLIFRQRQQVSSVLSCSTSIVAPLSSRAARPFPQRGRGPHCASLRAPLIRCGVFASNGCLLNTSYLRTLEEIHLEWSTLFSRYLLLMLDIARMGQIVTSVLMKNFSRLLKPVLCQRV